MTDAWLRENPPVRDQYRSPRREHPSGVMVVHTAENTPDTVATDGGAEAVANFIRTRSDAGSYHDLVDSDSGIQLVRYSDEAYQDATGSNPHAWGGSVATTAAWWPLAPTPWRDGAIRQLAHAAARYAQWLRDTYGVVVPARRITRAESEARVPGFISHAERDPARRSDPGAAFPWDQFLGTYAAAMGGQPLEDDMPTIDEFKTAMREVLNEGTGFGQLSWAGTSAETLKAIQHVITQNVAILQAAKDDPDVDEHVVAADVAEQLLPQLLAGLGGVVDPDQLVDKLTPALTGLVERLTTEQLQRFLERLAELAGQVAAVQAAQARASG